MPPSRPQRPAPTELVVSDEPEPGELVPVERAAEPAAVVPYRDMHPTPGLSKLPIAQEERAVLVAPVDPQSVEIRPDGVVFLPANAFRQKLTEVFGPGQWALQFERDPFWDQSASECYVDASLWIRGQFAARAVGGCKYQANNYGMSKTDAIEGAKSDCLRRCCKDLGIGIELWNKSYVLNWIAEYAVPYQGVDRRGTPKLYWRKTGSPLMGDAIANATGLAGEFPLGFGPKTPMPDGTFQGKPLAGVPLDELSEEALTAVAANAKLLEYRLAAKAEIIRRAREREQQAQTGNLSASDLVDTNQEESDA